MNFHFKIQHQSVINIILKNKTNTQKYSDKNKYKLLKKKRMKKLKILIQKFMLSNNGWKHNKKISKKQMNSKNWIK